MSAGKTHFVLFRVAEGIKAYLRDNGASWAFMSPSNVFSCFDRGGTIDPLGEEVPIPLPAAIVRVESASNDDQFAQVWRVPLAVDIRINADDTSTEDMFSTVNEVLDKFVSEDFCSNIGRYFSGLWVQSVHFNSQTYSVEGRSWVVTTEAELIATGA